MMAFDKVKSIGTNTELPRIEGFDDAFSRFNKSKYVLFPGFATCMCIFVNRVFLIKRPS